MFKCTHLEQLLDKLQRVFPTSSYLPIVENQIVTQIQLLAMEHESISSANNASQKVFGTFHIKSGFNQVPINNDKCHIGFVR